MTLKVKFEACTSLQLTRLHEASLELLEETGIVFHEPEALEILKKHGAKVEEKIAYIPRKMVESALQSCPSSFKWQAANDAHSLAIGEGPVLGSMVSAVNVMDNDRGMRPSTLEDFKKIIMLHQASDVMDFVTSMVVEANDVPVDHRPLYVTYETLKNCDKPFTAYNIIPSRQKAVEMLDMVEIRFGQLSEDKRVVMMSAPAASPLQWEQNTLQAMMEFARRGQPVAMGPCALAGVSCPIDLMGSALQTNVEVLSALTLLQLVNPGTPVIYHISNMSTNFKAVTGCWGSPEYFLMSLPNMQLVSEYYHIPTRSCSAVTTSKSVDYMAAIETTQSMLLAVLGGVDLVYCCCGTLENMLSYSYEKQILDEEIYSRAKRVYDGVEFSEETLSLDIIKQVGHGGSYLTHPSTIRKFRKTWMPPVSNYDLSDDSKANVMENAKNIMKQRLSGAPESLLDPSLDKELQKYMKKTLNLS